MNDIGAKTLDEILEAAAKEGRFALLEHEVYAFLALAGCQVPRWTLLQPGAELDAAVLCTLGERGSGRVFLKVVSPEIAHKTDVGGVARVPAQPAAVRDAAARMLDEVPRRYAASLEAKPGHAPAAYRGLTGAQLEAAIRRDIRGILVVEGVPCEGEGPGSEVLFGLRHNREFGPVLTVGVGGVDTELLGAACKSGLAVVSGSATLLDEQGLLAAVRPTLAYRRLAGLTRGGKRLLGDEALLDVIAAFRRVAARFGHDGEPHAAGESPWTVTELECNPFGASAGRLIALDGLLKFRPRGRLPSPRPLASMGPLMVPQSMAVIGVSAKGTNMGRIILRNVLEVGFPRDRAYVIRPDCSEIDGVRCVPSVGALPERVDLLVVAVSAEQVPDLMEEIAATDKATGVILIPGGMGEKAGGESLEARVKGALERAHGAGKSMVAVGGNCLGIISRPGKYHTIFVPQTKLPLPAEGRGNVAIISQSGAYMITRMSKLGWLSPRYAVSTGNQVDLTLSDFLRHLAEDQAVHTFAVYAEGFKDGDGLDFARATEEVVASGRDVIFYKAGRTAEGKQATSGHTASLAGDYVVCESIVRAAGAHVAKTFEEFLDLVKISSLMGTKRWRGRGLAALSNAGFEAVGIADNLRGEGWQLELTQLEANTRSRLAEALKRGKLDALVDVRNPLDLTPMASDEAHEDAVRAFLADAGVDVVLCATVPLSPVMATLPPGDGVAREQSYEAAGSLVGRLVRIAAETDKPVIASIDAGALYSPMVHALESRGIPTFRSVDAAVRAIGLYVEGHLR